MIIEELKDLEGKFTSNFIHKLEHFLINCNLDSGQRKELIKLLLESK